MAGRGVYAIGATADRQVRAKKSEAKRAATVKGNARAGASTAMRTRTWAGAYTQGPPSLA